ncbi:MAG: DoxX family membrane protein [Ignavibacteriae bacterium]|nr:DoxX family membrane protein [Ignavibacteriota bacterium]NOG96539.1 DoxX family membrane protein [Ignavibacteriota bacterium]
MFLLKNTYFLLIIRIILSIVFIISGIEKIANPSEFAQSIENYRLLPIFSINIFAIFLPWLELIAGMLLLFGIKIRENSMLITSLMMLFTTAVIIAIFRNLDIDCGCFGTLAAQKVGFRKVLENSVLICIGFILLFSKVQSSIELKN